MRASTWPFLILSPTSTRTSRTLPATSKLILELSAASTTPENFLILPEACSSTVTVLIARMRSTGGGGSSRQADSAKSITDHEKNHWTRSKMLKSHILILPWLIPEPCLAYESLRLVQSLGNKTILFKTLGA